MTTWVLGDVHGCARELEQLLADLRLSPEDPIVAVGDLFHRGPDPVGVMRIMQERRIAFVLGNHELAVLRRWNLAPYRPDASDRPPFQESFPDLDPPAPTPSTPPGSGGPPAFGGAGPPGFTGAGLPGLAGDGGRPCLAPAESWAEILRFLQGHSGFLMRERDVPGAGRTPDGRGWCVVHAGVAPDRPIEESPVDCLTGVRRLQGPGRPWWFESYAGEELVLFGHSPSPFPRAWHRDGKLVALGLDTGCVYGGRLTAYAPEIDEIASVKAGRPYADPEPGSRAREAQGGSVSNLFSRPSRSAPNAAALPTGRRWPRVSLFSWLK